MSLKQDNYDHISVLLDTVEKYAGLKKGDTAVDCTLGLGGHSEMFLKNIGDNGKLIVFELDEENLKKAQKRLNKYESQITYIYENFAHLQHELEKHGITEVNCILLDLGLASTFVDQPERGFSFKYEGPLDMRFDQREPLTAEKVINQYSEKRLVQIFSEYGEERYSKRLARMIFENRPIHTTTELAKLIERHKPRQKGRRPGKIHPATQIFQALRIEVNNELGVLEETLRQATQMLAKGGRLIVISYHSLEDRITKNIIREATKDCICPKEIPVCVCDHQPQLKIITKKPITPSEEEINNNPRSRSAKLRVAEKI